MLMRNPSNGKIQEFSSKTEAYASGYVTRVVNCSYCDKPSIWGGDVDGEHKNACEDHLHEAHQDIDKLEI